MRAGLSPAFTSGKLKNVMSSMNRSVSSLSVAVSFWANLDHFTCRCGPAFIDFITETLNRDGGDQVDVKPLLERYTLAVIAESVFGIRAEVFSVEETGALTTGASLDVLFTQTLVCLRISEKGELAEADQVDFIFSFKVCGFFPLSQTLCFVEIADDTSRWIQVLQRNHQHHPGPGSISCSDD